MSEKPIIFSAPMVRAILDGRKTMTRRILRPKAGLTLAEVIEHGEKDGRVTRCTRDQVQEPRIAPGDLLWVKEAWRPSIAYGFTIYRADKNREASTKILAKTDPTIRWRSPIYMPRSESRITLKVTAVKVERLQDMRLQDLEAEGIVPSDRCIELNEAVDLFKSLWASLHGPDSWEANPWVVAISFERVK